MKVSIIGGGGRVGSTAAYALQIGGFISEMVLVDVAKDLVEGEALDLRHGASMATPQKIYAGDYQAIEGSDIVIITAGLRRKPDESRLELINRNVTLFRDLLGNVRSQKLADNAILLIVSNPVDILTYIAVKESGLPVEQVIGLGTTLDTCRFRSLLAEFLNIAANDMKALILGEHGDSMVPIFSSATVNGIALSSYPGYDKTKMDNLFQLTKQSGAEVIRLKGGAGYAVGIAIKEVVNAISLDSKQTLPVSVFQQGALGISDVCLSLPTILTRKGVERVIEPVVSNDERKALQASAEVLKKTLKTVMG
jgi:L-lactate dehydrogenase